MPLKYAVAVKTIQLNDTLLTYHTKSCCFMHLKS